MVWGSYPHRTKILSHRNREKSHRENEVFKDKRTKNRTVRNLTMSSK